LFGKLFFYNRKNGKTREKNEPFLFTIISFCGNIMESKLLFLGFFGLFHYPNSAREWPKGFLNK